MSEILKKLQKDIHFIEGLNSCMNCGICTAICPAAEFYNYDPRVIVETVQRGNEEEIEELLKSDTIWYCGECMSCKTRCPRCNTPGLVIMALRKISQELGYFVYSEKGRQQYALKHVVGESILKRGYCVTPDLVKPEMHPEQGPVWEWIYEHLDDVYERMHSNYRQPGAGALREVDSESMDELRKIFDVTGGTEFLEKIDSCSQHVADEEKVDLEEAYFLKDALKFREALPEAPLIYVGGLVARQKIDEVLDAGFEAVQMGRALLNEPGFVNRMKQEEQARCSCGHSNYCIGRMYSIEMACHQHLKETLPPCLQKEIEKLEKK